jgi:hypothetical protein
MVLAGLVALGLLVGGGTVGLDGGHMDGRGFHALTKAWGSAANRRRVLALPLLALALGLAQIAPASAAVFINERLPLTFHVINDCTGEVFPAEGVFHLQGRVTESESGNLHVGAHTSFTAQGVSASGVKYQFTSLDNQQTNVGADSANNFTFTHTTKVIRQGEDSAEDDLTGRAMFHATVNANGEVTAVFADIRIDCN